MTNRPSLFPETVPQLARLQTYSSQSYDGEINLKLDANEGPALFNLNDVDQNGNELNRYPSAEALQRDIAEFHGINIDQVLVTAGGDESIDRVCRSYLQPGQILLTTEPTFSMIAKYAAMTGAQIHTLPWLGTDFPVEKMIESVEERTRIVAIVSPNNPTGQTIEIEQLQSLAEAVPDRILLIDQAYAEFENSNGSLTRFALDRLPNAVVVRSFSKAWGLAGIRVGYALASAEIMLQLRKMGGPYTVARPSLALAQKALNRCPDAHIRKIRSQRNHLDGLLREFGCTTTPSQGNFVFAQFGSRSLNAKFAFRSLAAQGILVRLFEDLNAIRITCPGEDDALEQLSQTLGNILRPTAVLFDMDGVLVDEGPSYRESIRRTCDYFGERLTSGEIAELKLAGDANNDWIFTHRVLAQRGKQIDFEQVKDRFERIHQGDGHSPGLWSREVQLVEKDWLQQLSERYPLGIVTGRPRNDAIRFLRNAGIEELFSTIVCMEDGPAKPDPSNVRTALGQLNASSAWMIGDTPDDIFAARGAGVVAVGIAAPEDNEATATTKLLSAGASTIVANLEEFGELLP